MLAAERVRQLEWRKIACKNDIVSLLVDGASIARVAELRQLCFGGVNRAVLENSCALARICHLLWSPRIVTVLSHLKFLPI